MFSILASYRFSVNNFLRPVKFRLILAGEGVQLVPLEVLDDERASTYRANERLHGRPLGK